MKKNLLKKKTKLEKESGNTMAIGKRISKLRNNLNLTQKELAQRLFVTDKALSSWENERTEPDIEALLNLSEIFNCSVNYLINGEAKRNDTETQIKIELSQKEYLNLKLLLKNKISEIFQVDTYYKTNKPNCYLRIRNVGNKNIITYKKKQQNCCEELEVEIDDAHNMNKIFAALDIKKLVEIEKQRITYNYLNKYEIALDNVKKVGYFIEIEIKKYEFKQEEEYQKLLQVAKDLGLNLKNIAHKHYLDYRLERK